MLSLTLAFSVAGSLSGCAREVELDASVTLKDIEVFYPASWTLEDSDSDFAYIEPPDPGLAFAYHMNFWMDIDIFSSTNSELIDALLESVYDGVGLADSQTQIEALGSWIEQDGAAVQYAKLTTPAGGIKLKGYMVTILMGSDIYVAFATIEEAYFTQYDKLLLKIVESIDIDNNNSKPESEWDEPDSPIENASGQTVYQPGMYKVGTNLPAGEYYFTPAEGEDSAYICAYPDSTKEDILDNAFFSGGYYLTVKEGQYLEVDRTTFIAVTELTPELQTSIEEGVYKVGLDIPAGKYELLKTTSDDSTDEFVADRSASYAVYNNSTVDKVLKNYSYFDTSDFVIVTEGQYLELSRCKGTLVE